jgi:hypothetical protein
LRNKATLARLIFKSYVTRGAAKVVANLESVTTVTPATERQARERARRVVGVHCDKMMIEGQKV